MKTGTKYSESKVRRRILRRIRYVDTLDDAVTAFKAGAAAVVLPNGKNEEKTVILARNKFAMPIHDLNEVGWLTCEPTRLKSYKKRTLPTYLTCTELVDRLIEQMTQLALFQVVNELPKRKLPPPISRSEFLKLYQQSLTQRK